jgi:hypothetical protein
MTNCVALLLAQLACDRAVWRQICHCIWLLSYTNEIKPRLADMQTAAILTHILKQVQKEKVSIMFIFRHSH